jgi:hypothetical protein
MALCNASTVRPETSILTEVGLRLEAAKAIAMITATALQFQKVY